MGEATPARCHGCRARTDLMHMWGQLWCVNCATDAAKDAAGVYDERIWPETEELCREDFIPNMDESDFAPVSTTKPYKPQEHEVPEGGLICKFDVMELERWMLL